MQICVDCKIEKLNQINVNMTVSIGYTKIGRCDICKQDNKYLYDYEEKCDEEW